MDWWTDMWAMPSWLQDVMDRTSWLELIAAFVSVIASVFIALKIQDRDFQKRTAESHEAEAARLESVTQERRRALIERTFDLLTAIQVYDQGQNFADQKARRLARSELRRRIDKVGALFALEPNYEGSDFGPVLSDWMHEVLNLRPGGRRGGDRSVVNPMVDFLVRWGRGEFVLHDALKEPLRTSLFSAEVWDEADRDDSRPESNGG